jgi:hypothetical protein
VPAAGAVDRPTQQRPVSPSLDAMIEPSTELTTEEAAAILDVRVRTLYNTVHRGVLARHGGKHEASTGTRWSSCHCLAGTSSATTTTTG